MKVLEGMAGGQEGEGRADLCGAERKGRAPAANAALNPARDSGTLPLVPSSCAPQLPHR